MAAQLIAVATHMACCMTKPDRLAFTRDTPTVGSELRFRANQGGVLYQYLNTSSERSRLQHDGKTHTFGQAHFMSACVKARALHAHSCKRAYPCLRPWTPTCPRSMVAKRPTCHETKYSQKGLSRPGPCGKCESSVAICALKRPKSELPPKAPTGIAEGTVHLRGGRKGVADGEGTEIHAIFKPSSPWHLVSRLPRCRHHRALIPTGTTWLTKNW
jgi:hypothetical protein